MNRIQFRYSVVWSYLLSISNQTYSRKSAHIVDGWYLDEDVIACGVKIQMNEKCERAFEGSVYL